MKAPCRGDCGYSGPADEDMMLGDCARCHRHTCFGCEGGADSPEGGCNCGFDHLDLCAKCWCDLHDEDTKAVRALEVARELVAKGWMQSGYWAPGRYCADGAIIAACSKRGEPWDFMVTNDVPTGTRVRLFKWNDAPGRTQAEVLALFDRAIELGKAVAR